VKLFKVIDNYRNAVVLTQTASLLNHLLYYVMLMQNVVWLWSSLTIIY